MGPNEILKLSDEAVEFLNNCVSPIMTQGYIGWVVPLPRKFKSVLVVDYSTDKQWDLLHKNIKKTLSKRQIIKSLKFLQSRGWLCPFFTTPFEEFSPELKVNPQSAIIVPPEEDVTASNEVVDFLPKSSIIEYDDDVSGIYLMEENNNAGKK